MPRSVNPDQCTDPQAFAAQEDCVPCGECGVNNGALPWYYGAPSVMSRRRCNRPTTTLSPDVYSFYEIARRDSGISANRGASLVWADAASTTKDYELEECATICQGVGSTYFMHGKSARSQDCACYPVGEGLDVGDGDGNTNWDIYKITGTVPSTTLAMIPAPSLAPGTCTECMTAGFTWVVGYEEHHCCLSGDWTDCSCLVECVVDVAECANVPAPPAPTPSDWTGFSPSPDWFSPSPDWFSPSPNAAPSPSVVMPAPSPNDWTGFSPSPAAAPSPSAWPPAPTPQLPAPTPSEGHEPCLKISREVLHKVEAMGYRVLTCDQRRRMRRLKGLNPGPPCAKSKSSSGAQHAFFHI